MSRGGVESGVHPRWPQIPDSESTYPGDDPIATSTADTDSEVFYHGDVEVLANEAGGANGAAGYNGGNEDVDLASAADN